MTSAAVLVADRGLIALAGAWASAGLLGETIWLERGGCAAGLDRAEWQRTGALVVPAATPGAPRRAAVVEDRTPFQRHLAAIDGLSEISVAWVRRADCDDRPGMESLQSFLRGVINPSITVRLVDAVIPTSLQQLAVPAAPSGWRQVLVAPEDHRDLNALDAGWVGAEDPITLHVAAALVGRLGGRHAVPAPPPTPGLEFAAVVSRHVVGAQRAWRRAEHYLDHALPQFSALDVSAARHELLDDEWREVDRAAAWLSDEADGAFEHRPEPPADPDSTPFPPSAGPPRSSSTPPWRRALVEFVQGRDPYEDAAEAPADPAAAPLHPRAWEEAARPRFEEELSAAALNGGVLPPPRIWRSLVSFVTSLTDGGELPTGYAPAMVQERHGVVTPAVVWPSGGAPAQPWTDDQVRTVPELAYAPPATLAAAALTEARAALQGSDAPLRPVKGGAIGTLSDQLSSADQQQREAQVSALEALRLPEPGQGPLPLFDRVYAHVLASTVWARSDARRWHDRAVAAWPEPSWLTARVRAGAGVATVVALVGLGLWAVFRDSFNQWLASQGVTPPADPVVIAVLGLIVVASLVIGYLITLRVIKERDTYWRWRMGARLALRVRALAAYRDQARLENALRIATHWRRILLAVLPQGDARPDTQEPPPEGPLPEGLGWAFPWLHRPYEEVVVRGAGAQPGFRTAILSDVARSVFAGFLDRPVLEPLVELSDDSGFTDGSLDRLARDLEDGAWDRWRDDEVGRIARRVRAAIAAAGTPVASVEGGPTMTLASFVGEADEQAAFTPGFLLAPDAAAGETTTVHRWSSLHRPAEGAPLRRTFPEYACSGALVLRHRARWLDPGKDDPPASATRERPLPRQ